MGLRNYKFLVQLLAGRPHSTGAEVGVFEGECALGLLEGLPQLKTLICVDIWKFDKEFYDLMPNKEGKILNADWNRVWLKYQRRIHPYRDRVETMRMTSLDAAKLVKDSSLDFVFIDANHAYEYVKPDIDAWLPKVIEGGTICGDDYRNKPNYGVIQAVKETFAEFSVDKRSGVWHAWKGGSEK